MPGKSNGATPADDIFGACRRLLNYRISIAGLLEIGLWLAIPYLVIGLVWAFFRVEQVDALRFFLERFLPAGSEVAAYVLAAALWPVQLILLVLPALCVR